MQTSIKPEKIKRTVKLILSPKELEELKARQKHKGKHHKTKRGSRPEWEAY